MGIDVISSATGAQSYQGTSKPVSEVLQPAESPNAGQKQAQNLSAVEYSTEKEAQSDAVETEKQSGATMKDVHEINKIINQNTVAEFGYNEPTNRITIKIKDKETDEVIKEIPSEKALEMLAKVWELAGMLVDEKR